MFYNKFISCLYMFRAHVLIIRRSKLHYTASGIITHIGVILCIKLVNYSDKYVITSLYMYRYLHITQLLLRIFIVLIFKL